MIYDDENLNITGYNEHFSITSWINIEEKISPYYKKLSIFKWPNINHVI